MKFYLRRAHVAELEPLTRTSSLIGTRFGSYILGCTEGLENELRVGSFTIGLLSGARYYVKRDFDGMSDMSLAYWNSASRDTHLALSIKAAICIVDSCTIKAAPFEIGKFVSGELCKGHYYYEELSPHEPVYLDNLIKGELHEIVARHPSP